jgi:hypothetical protein
MLDNLLPRAAALLQVPATTGDPASWDLWRAITTFINTPAPYSPFTEYLLVLFVLWLFARRSRRLKEDFSQQAQEVLDRKREEGELSHRSYEKFRQHLSLRPKR